MDCNNKKVLLW